jgi:mannosyltransferase
LLLLLIAFAVRVLSLNQQSLWFDEGWSWHLAKMPLSDMALTTAGDRSPPLYYALLHMWIALAGESEFAMRFISVLADVATVALVIALARLLTCSRGAAFAAGVLYALNPFAIWYAQEVRQYALVAALCTASTVFLLKWLIEGARGEGQSSKVKRHASLAVSAVALALAVYCHYYAVFLLPAQFMVVLIALWQSAIGNRKSKIVAWLIAAFAVVLSVAPWLLVASAGFAYDDGFFFPLNTIDGRLLEWWRGFAAGGITRPLPDWWLVALIVPMLIGAMGLLLMPRRQPWPNWARLLMLVALIAGPLLAATIAVRVVYPYRSVFHVRYLIYVVPVVCVLWGATFTQFRVPSAKSRVIRAVAAIASIALLAALWLPVLSAYFTEPAYARDDTRGAVKHVVEALEPGDVVVMTRDNFAVRYYWPADKADALIAEPAGLHGILSEDQGIINDLNAKQPKRVRLMLWQDDVVDPQKFVESSLWPRAFELGEYNFAQIRLPLYSIEWLPLESPAFIDNGATFNGELQLNSHWLRRAGDWFYAVLNWQPLKPINKDYKVFVHVRDANGNVVFQNDKLPLNALLPMTRWQAGAPLRDAHAMVIPQDLPAGAYQVVAGVYDPVTGQRLLTADGNDAVTLGHVEITR